LVAADGRPIEGIDLIFVDKGYFHIQSLFFVFPKGKNVMPGFWVCSEIMEYPWHVSHLPIKNPISLSKMDLKVIDQTLKILFLRTVIEGKDG
jgi:hypothetical protein